jgi:tetratricopeptide (TPR) repeat protein
MKLLLVICFALATASAQMEVAAALNDRGLEASDARRFDDARKLFTEAIAQYQALGSRYDAHAAIVRMNLAQVYGGEGKRAECAALLEESLAVFRRTLGLDNLNALTTANVLASMYMMLGEPERAIGLLEEVLPIERKLYPSDVQLARTLGGLASLHMRQGRVDKGMAFAEESLAVSTKTQEGDDSLEAALAYANLGEGHRVSGRPERALPLFRKARTIYSRRLGPEHPRVASVLMQEGVLFLADGKLGLAEQSLTQALGILDKSCPLCTFERVAAENDLALLRIRQKKYDAADRLLSDVLAMQEKSHALPGQEIAVTLQSLAVVRQKERRYEDAERLQRRALVLTGSYR